MKLCALSVDLDEIPCYHAIHGLPMPTDASAHAVYAVAVPRFLDLLSELRVPCTFFVIGRDMDDPTAIDGARALHAAGHELANHTQNHRYDLVRLTPDAQRAEILDGIASVARVRGDAPTGFRAPGYTITDAIFDVLREAGVRYDSSVFPCPAYWAAKTAAIGAISLRGRESRSVIDTPAVLSAPADPYRPGRPYFKPARGGEGLIELPVGVTRFARLPYIGTTLCLAGEAGTGMLTRQIIGRPLVNLEMHGIDLLDAADGLDALRPHQPDVRVSLSQKLKAVKAAVHTLRRQGYTFVTLDEAARTFSAAA